MRPRIRVIHDSTDLLFIGILTKFGITFLPLEGNEAHLANVDLSDYIEW